MCGIAGLFDGRGSLNADTLREHAVRMADAIAHRGPDDSGVWADPECGLALSHRRLSILDLSPAGHQPMLSAAGRYVISFNGEIFNFRALRSELEGQGARFKGGSDTEVMLAAFERWGLRGALERFNGMFAFALWDRAERTLHLARDRAGEKPLYYGRAGVAGGSGPLLFGSELKALRAHPDFKGEVDRDALCTYLRYNYVPTPYSIYKGVRKLPPGSFVSFRFEGDGASAAGAAGIGAGGSLPEPQRYWEAEEAASSGLASPFNGSETEAKAELSRLIEDAVRIRLESDVPLGAFLSGGVDSSLVVAMMQRVSSAAVKTFTIGFGESGYDEAAHAREVARHLGTEHTELYLTADEATGAISRLPTLYDEPFADASQLPTFLLSQMTRQHVTVSLSGDGGDELFGGYNRYFWGRSIWRRMHMVPLPVRRLMSRALMARSASSWDRSFERFGPLLPRRTHVTGAGHKLHKLAGALDADSPLSLYRRLVSQWQEPGRVVISGAEPPGALSQVARRAGFGDGTDADIAEQMMLFDLRTYLPDDILVKVDRAAMGVSLETRIPLLDHRLIEFAWTLPLSMKMQGTQGKLLLRSLLDDHVPRELIERPKMGFGVPVDSWLRGPLREWAEELLDSEAIRADGFFDPEPIRSEWNEHLSGTQDRHNQLWGVLMFQSWLRNERG